MRALLKLSALIDAISEVIGKLIIWLVLACVLISAGNAIVRRAFNYSSNAYLEIQWYLFAAVFMLGAEQAHLHPDDAEGQAGGSEPEGDRKAGQQEQEQPREHQRDEVLRDEFGHRALPAGSPLRSASAISSSASLSSSDFSCASTLYGSLRWPLR